MTNVDKSWAKLMTELRQVGERGSEDPEHFRKIEDLFDRIPELVLYDDTPEPGASLVHYTAWKNARDMFDAVEKSPVLRMYNYEQCNDPDEGQIRPPEWKEIEENANWFDDFLKDDNRWTEDMKFGGSTYGCSFSSGQSGVEDDLTYWRLYGNDGRGCSLKISNLSEPYATNLYKVRYRDKDSNNRTQADREEDEQVVERLRDLCKVGKETVENTPDKYKNIVGKTIAEGLRRAIYGYYHLIKHIAYAGEREWRMIRVMPRLEYIHYDSISENLVKRYIEGPRLDHLLKTSSVITIGPTVFNRGAARAYLEHLAKKKHEIRYVVVKNSKKTYRQSLSPSPAQE